MPVEPPPPFSASSAMASASSLRTETGHRSGAQLLRSERASDHVPGQTLDVCGAASQGEIGYLLAQSLQDELAAADLHIPVVSIVTQTVVSRPIPHCRIPTKPIGPFYSRSDAEERQRQLGWQIVEDAARGYRRVVPSPEPVEIIELEVIRELTGTGTLVVACGGGGIPVVRENGQLRGIEAVIDKDRASALLACQLGVDIFAISTDTDYVYLNYKTSRQQRLESVMARRNRNPSSQRAFSAGEHGAESGIRPALPSCRRTRSPHHLLRAPVRSSPRHSGHANCCGCACARLPAKGAIP